MASKDQISLPTFASFTPTWHTSPYDAISPRRPELSAAGRRVVVTGGGSGIGKAIAKGFAQAGASYVAILGRREDRLLGAIREITEDVEEHQPVLLYQQVDLTDREDTKTALLSIVNKMNGKIDIFVSNAGAFATAGPVLVSEEENFMQGFDYNVRIPLNAIHAFLPHAAAGAILLNISSGVAHMKPIPGLGAHAVSKAAGTKLIDYVQAENPDLHVVNVQPGGVNTEMTQAAGTGDNLKDDVNPPGHFCVWLASTEAAFLKGKFVWANWDVQEMQERAKEIQSTRLLSILLDGVPM